MAEYIEREALLSHQYNASRSHEPQLAEMVVDVRDIEDAPAADVVPVRHGRWIRYEDTQEHNKLPIYTRPGRKKPNFAYLHKSALRYIPQLQFANPITDADFRAITPPGFAQAFFRANQ